MRWDCCLNKSQLSDDRILSRIVFACHGSCHHKLPRSWKVGSRSRGRHVPGHICNFALAFTLPERLFRGCEAAASSFKEDFHCIAEGDLRHEIVSCHGVLERLPSHWQLRRVVGGKEVLWMPCWLVQGFLLELNLCRRSENV